MTQSSLGSLVEPAFRSVPAHLETLGPEVATICEMAGFAPDPEQQMCLDAMFAIDSRGRTAAFEFGVVCPRQNMKTGLLKMAVLGWLFVTEQRLIVWSAHEMKTTKEAFRDLEELIKGSPALRSRLAPTPTEGIYHGNGEESIELATGQRVMFKARTHGGGRGLTGDKVILDEAMYLEDSHMGSLLPTMAARPDPQVCYAGSAGLEKSDVLRDIRDRGRSGADPSLAYFEWAVDRGGCEINGCMHELEAVGCALDDESKWAKSNPALGRRILRDTLRAMRRAMPPTEFAREFLSWWDDPGMSSHVFGATNWAACATHEPDPPVAAIGLAVSLDLEWGSIGAAGRRGDGRINVGSVKRERGTTWLVAEAKRIQDEHDCDVIVDEKCPDASLIPALEDAGVRVTVAKMNDYIEACSEFVNGVKDKLITHQHTTELDNAIKAAAWRMVGDRKVWGRKQSSADISMLEAVTLARWAASSVYDLLDSVY